MAAAWGGNPRNDYGERDDPRIERLARMLVPGGETPESDANSRESSHAKSTTDGFGEPSYRYYFKSVTTGRRLLDQLTSLPTNVPYEVAVNRLKGSVIGPDGHQTCLIVTLTDQAIGNFPLVVGRDHGDWPGFHRREGLLFGALRACDIDPGAVHLGGPPIDNVAIDEEGERTLVRLASLAGVVGLVVAWWSLRSVKLTLIVFACGLLLHRC